MPKSAEKRLLAKAISGIVATAVIATPLVVGVGTVAAAPAAAAAPLLCETGEVYVQKNGAVHHFNTATNMLSRTALISDQQTNGLGISDGGRYVFSIQNGATDDANRIIVHDTQTSMDTKYNAPASTPDSILRGAVNPNYRNLRLRFRRGRSRHRTGRWRVHHVHLCW